MNILIFLLALLLATPAHAIILVGFGGSSCGTQSSVVSQLTTDDSYDTWLSGAPLWKNTRGQSFSVPSSVTLYSVVLKGSTATGGSSTVTMRVGTGIDLTTYVAQSNALTISDNVDSVREFVFPTRPALSSGTTYYFGVSSDATLAGNAFNVDLITTSAYAGGTTYKTTSATWVLDNALTTDLYFNVKKCD